MVTPTYKMIAIDLDRTLLSPEANGQAVLALQDTGAAGGIDYLVSDEVALNAETLHWMSITSAKVHPVSRLSTYSHVHTIRLGMVGPTQEVAKVHEQLLEKFGE